MFQYYQVKIDFYEWLWCLMLIAYYTNISSNVGDVVELDNQRNIEQKCREHISMVTGASDSIY